MAARCEPFLPFFFFFFSTETETDLKSPPGAAAAGGNSTCVAALGVCESRLVRLVAGAAAPKLYVQLSGAVRTGSAALFVFAERVVVAAESANASSLSFAVPLVLAVDSMMMSSRLAVGNWSVSLAPHDSFPNASFAVSVESGGDGVQITVVLLDVVALAASPTPAAPQCRAVGAPTHYSLELPPALFPAGQPLRVDARAVAPLMGSTCAALHGWLAVDCLRDVLYRAPPRILSLLHDNVADAALDGASLRICSAEDFLVRGVIRDCDALAAEAGFVSWWAAVRFVDGARSSDATAAAVALGRAARALWHACPAATLCGATACRRGVSAGVAISFLLHTKSGLPGAYSALCLPAAADNVELAACVRGLGAGVATLAADASSYQCRPFRGANGTFVEACGGAAQQLALDANGTAAFVSACVAGGFEKLHHVCAFDASLVANDTLFGAYAASACNATDAATVDACTSTLGETAALRANFNAVRVDALCGNVTACASAAQRAIAPVVARASTQRSDWCLAVRLFAPELDASVPVFGGVEQWLPITDGKPLPSSWVLDGGGVDMKIAMRVVAVPTDAPTPMPTPETTTAEATLGHVPTFAVSPGCKAHCQQFCGSSAAALCVCAGQKIACRNLANNTDRAMHGAMGDVGSEVAPVQQGIPAWLVPLCVLGALALIGVGFCAAALARYRRRHNAFARRRA